MNRTFVMVKPDGVARNLIGVIMTRFERKGLKLTNAKMMNIDRELAEKHYIEHVGKPFFEELIDFIMSGPVFAMVWEGQDAVKNARSLIGRTNPSEAAPGTIRADYALDVSSNIVHGSDSDESAEREITNFFGKSFEL
ncbi:nucleoside diphosphate kinase [Paenibacillus cellulosilyticus]|uniref:Nucleoside diphosphate kinase n=1 Tax=Paenibacillus cellulosilyticus TaxID=375489 RepID=A0A2V2YT78_9BACL|nr:nucleoside-diphosphate kinase [Paenibacillus cellulosilyticus]PWW02532.1 nucleoside diphosphate kinase [Paenibacillus cellulosilyticus]QKS47229.1 nucleoside-diphosphate kinase [Paenibacillus cellulosilyticus]